MLKLTSYQKKLIKKGIAFYDNIDDYYYVTSNTQFIIFYKNYFDYLPYVKKHFLDPRMVFAYDSEEKADEVVKEQLLKGISVVKIII